MNAIEKLEQAWRVQGVTDSIDDIHHGDMGRWRNVLEELPAVDFCEQEFGNEITIGHEHDLDDTEPVLRAIEELIPWRKGPFRLFGKLIDSEWRSDMKWRRVQPYVDFSEKSVLDVGSGNGYYGWRMLGAGAESVLGIDSSLLCSMQSALVGFYANRSPTVVCKRFDEFAVDREFDVVLSMGVLYHQRDWRSHLRNLTTALGKSGTLVVESIVASRDILPTGRYARMRNVWFIPSVQSILLELQHLGFDNARVVDVSITTPHEQRTTPQMPFESLREALSKDQTRTVEGYPAPRRAVVVASR